MTDATTKKPLTVSRLGTDWLFIRVPMNQLDEVRSVLDRNQVVYSVAEHAISWDGGPYMILIDLDRKIDPTAVQALLDDAI